MATSEGYITAEDGVRLFFQKSGSNAIAVIVPNAVHMFDSFKDLTGNRALIFFDLRNRGRSDSVTGSSKLARGILHDVDDLEAVRRHFGLDRVNLIGHSYLGLVVILYAMRYPDHVNRLVQIGPIQPNARTQYPAHLTGADATLAEFTGRLAQLQKDGPSGDPWDVAGRFWALLRKLMVAEPADADKIHWNPFECQNELKFMKHWTENLFPSIQRLDLVPEELSKVITPVLTIHGTRDRQAPYGGGREWALILPNARLITVENAAHVPWIEAPHKVFDSIETFFAGAWPLAAQKVSSLEPGDGPG